MTASIVSFLIKSCFRVERKKGKEKSLVLWAFIPVSIKNYIEYKERPLKKIMFILEIK